MNLSLNDIGSSVNHKQHISHSLATAGWINTDLLRRDFREIGLHNTNHDGTVNVIMIT